MGPFIRDKLDSQKLDHIVNDKDPEFVHFFGLIILKSFAKHTVIQLFNNSES